MVVSFVIAQLHHPHFTVLFPRIRFKKPPFPLIIILGERHTGASHKRIMLNQSLHHNEHRVGFVQISLDIPQMLIQRILHTSEYTFDNHRLDGQFILRMPLQFITELAMSIVELRC